MTRAASLLFVFFLTTGPLWAAPIAMVTEVKGHLTAQGKTVPLLGYIEPTVPVELKAGSHATFSYVTGGVRVKASGPCILRLQPDGPVVDKGDKTLVQVTRPAKRVGQNLPSDLDLSSGGHLRRGELTLSLPSKLLPGRQLVSYSAMPSLREFRLTVANSSTFEEVFQGDQVGSGPFELSAGTLKPGQSYDFLLQGTSDSGQTLEIEQTAVVLSEEIAQGLREEALLAAERPGDFAAQTELLARYLRHGLDDLALGQTETLLSSAPDDSQLLELREKLRTRMGLHTN